MNNSVSRIFDIYHYQQRNYPNLKAFNYKVDNQWYSLSINDFINKGNLLSTSLINAGIKKNDTIGLVSNTRYEWHLVDFAVSQIGAILVPLYPNITAPEYAYIINEAEFNFIFIDNLKIFNTVNQALRNIKRTFHIYTFDVIPDVKHYNELLNVTVNLEAITEKQNQIKETDLATIIYTSGTEDVAKGVMLSHKNIVSNILATQKIFNLNRNDRGLSFLPLNHVYEKTVSSLFIYAGVSIYYAESLLKIIDNAKEIKPTIFACIPLLIKKIYNKILEKGCELKGIKKIIFNKSIQIAHNWDNEKGFRPWYEFQRFILDKLVYKKWRAALGGEIKIIASGSAAINPLLIRVFNCAKIALLEGYGLTETSPIVSVNLPKSKGFRLGTVGPLLEGVQAKINPDGEILIKGDLIMQGYFKHESKTKQVISNDGWFATGDIGEWVDNKYLKITDRKKEIFKTMGGKYVAPQVVEAKLLENPLIEHCISFGANKEVVAALLIPNWELLKKWCHNNKIPFETNEQAIKESVIKELYANIVAKSNKNLSSHEQVRRHELVNGIWSIETGELTPTLKLKRKNILKKYDSICKKIFPE